MNIKNLIEESNFDIVCDTNVYLNIYRESHEMSDFILECLDHVKEYIVLPETIVLEYERNRHKSLKKRRDKFKDSVSEAKNKLVLRKEKFLICVVT